MRLFWKIYLTYAAFIAISMVLFSMVVSHREAKNELSKLQQEQRLIATIAALQVDAGYHEKSWPFEMLNSIASEESFISWTVLDGSGKIILSKPTRAKEQLSSIPIPQNQPQLVVNADLRTETWVVPMRMRTGTKPWRFCLTYDTCIIDPQVHSMQRINLLFALGIALCLAPLSIVMTRWWFRPLILLAQAAKNIGDGKTVDDLGLPKTGCDEVGQLVHAFECMRQGIDERDQRIHRQFKTIQQAHDELETRVQQRTAELEKSTDALQSANCRLEQLTHAAEAANLAKSHFLANMSHEIRTPMTAILGYVDILSDACESSETLETAATVKRNGQHLLEIINDILDLSKIEAGQFKTEYISCDLTEIFANVTLLMQVRAKKKKLRLKILNEGPIPSHIQSDPTRIRQILFNLVGNAIKFTKEGEVQLVVRLIDQEQAEPKIQFDVIDTGIGVSQKQIGGLFSPFTQGDMSTSREYGGTGLGLAVSKRLAQLLGGDIDVQSIQGKGSTFTVTIATGPLDGVKFLEGPIEMEPVVEQSYRPIDEVFRLESRVLLAEDSIDNQRLISFLLRKAGADVTIAENGQVAYELAMKAREDGNPFDVVLMDMQMPVLDGYAATKALRKAGYTGTIIALTAHAMSSDRNECLDAGCDDYMTKPINRDRLVIAIAHWDAVAKLRVGIVSPP